MSKSNRGEKSPILNINLRAKPKETIGNVFIKWGVNSGKLIIITTELIALSALFYRFSVDRRIIDLNDQIKKEQTFIANQSTKEEEYRSVHKRLEQIKLITDETDERVTLLNSILNTLKGTSFTDTNLAVDNKSIHITGNALSIFAINSFIEELKKSKKVDTISLDDVSSGDDGIRFSIQISLNSQIPDEVPVVETVPTAVPEETL